MTIFNRRFILACILIGLLAQSTFAATYYVSQNGNGSTNSLAWLNSTYGWTPGDTINLVGTLTNTLHVNGSGTAGNPITIYFEPNAQFSTPTLPTDSQFLYLAGQSWITIDGGSNGVIQLTDNGTVAANGGTKDHGNSGISGIYASPIDHVVIKNLAIENIYNRQTNTEAIQGANGDGYGIYWQGSDLVVSNCFLTGEQEMISGVYSASPSSNLTIVSCVLSNYNHGIILGSGGVANPIFSNVAIMNNRILSGDMYETSTNVSDLGLHRNGIFIFNESELAPGSGGATSGYITNLLICNNYIQAGYHPLSLTAGSGGIFLDTYTVPSTVHVRVYNNISVCVPPLSYSGGGGNAEAGGIDVLFANNTIVNGIGYGGYSWTIGGTNAFAFNNISISSHANWISTSVNITGLANNNATVAQLLSGITTDHNIFNGTMGYSGWVETVNGGGLSEILFDSFSQFQNMLGGLLVNNIEPHSTTATVQLGSGYAPLSTDTVAIGNGTNLTAWGITNDFAGNPRPATGNWTIGAYQVATGVSDPTISVTPSSEAFGTVAVGTTTNEILTVQNTGSGTLTGSASVSAPFSIISGGIYSLAAGQSSNVTISYNPTIAGANTQTATFSGGGGASVVLNGTSALPPPQNLVPHAPGT